VIDSHAHLAMFQDGEVEGVLARAEEAGVERILAPATGPGDLERTVALRDRFPERVVAAVGCHPHEAAALDAALKRRLEGLVGRDGVVAIGEIGLDYHYEIAPREDQRRALAWQLALAVESGLPVVLHEREAWPDFLAALAAQEGVRGVAHCFTAGVEAAQEVVARGLAVGIAGMVTFPKAEQVKAMVAALPLDRLLLETDSPYLAPVPHRGQRNEPALVRLVGEAVARERSTSLAEVEAVTSSTFARLFGPGAGVA